MPNAALGPRGSGSQPRKRITDPGVGHPAVVREDETAGTACSWWRRLCRILNQYQTAVSSRVESMRTDNSSTTTRVFGLFAGGRSAASNRQDGCRRASSPGSRGCQLGRNDVRLGARRRLGRGGTGRAGNRSEWIHSCEGHDDGAADFRYEKSSCSAAGGFERMNHTHQRSELSGPEEPSES